VDTQCCAKGSEMLAQGMPPEVPFSLLMLVSPFLFFLLVIFLLAANPFCGWLIGKEKGRGRQGFLLGLFFGPIGVMTIGFITPKVAKC
jgi:hypothetical protein